MEIEGFIDLPFRLCCDQSAMGKEYAISIAGIEGILETPELVGWPCEVRTSLEMPNVMAPRRIKDWTIKDRLKDWGYANSIRGSQCSSIVSRVLVRFSVRESLAEQSVQLIREAGWIKLFADYYQVMENRGFSSTLAKENPMSGLELFYLSEGKVTYPKSPRISVGAMIIGST